MSKHMRILVSVIAYNEEKNIAKAIRDLQENNFGYDIIVIDNSSTDDTVKIAKDMGVSVVRHCINSGSSSGAMMTYFNYAFYKDYDILCQFDGDGQHKASELSKIVQPILNEEADYVIGSRFIRKEGFQSTHLRRMGIHLFSFIDSLILRKRITDITSGARAYSKRIIRYFAINYRHEIYDTSQLLLISHFSGAKIMEVPVTMEEREHGESEYTFLNAMSFPIKGMINIIGTLLQKSQLSRQ